MNVGEDPGTHPVFIVDLDRAKVEVHGGVDAGLGLEFSGDLGVDPGKIVTSDCMVVFAAGLLCKGVHRFPCGTVLGNIV